MFYRLSAGDLTELGLLTANYMWYLGDPDTSTRSFIQSKYDIGTLTIPISSCGSKAGSASLKYHLAGS